jgi:hypothetical protein
VAKTKEKHAPRKLPKRIYGKWEPMDDEFFVNTAERAETLVERGEKLRVGIYELVGYAVVENKTEVIPE